MTAQINDEKKQDLGRLKSLGITEPWKAVMYLPKEWDDFSSAIIDFRNTPEVNTRQMFSGRLNGSMETRFDKGPPRLMGSLVDENGTSIRFSAMGDTRELQSQISQSATSTTNHGIIHLFGKVTYYNGVLWLNSVEHIDPRWVGRLRPRYAGKPRVMTPDSVRDSLPMAIKEGIDEAVIQICQALVRTEPEVCELLGLVKDGKPISLRKVLLAAHFPSSRYQGEYSQSRIEIIAAIRAIMQSRDSQRAPGESRIAGKVQGWEVHAQSLPFKLSGCQVRAVEEVISDLKGKALMRRLLSGDVGYGKTAVFAIAAAAVHAAGGRVAIMLPNEALAEQCYREIIQFWPSISSDTALITSSSPPNEPVSEISWVIGTTALLFQEAGELDLLIVDEQQKFSREQREKMAMSMTHVLESTATCIPRSQALIQYGGMQHSILDEPPVVKDIRTRILKATQQRELFESIQATVNEGGQVLIVYPRRDDGDGGASAESDTGAPAQSAPTDSVDEAAVKWEKYYPGQIRVAHAGMPESHNEKALRDMRDEEADILVATTVVEVGVNIPNLRRVVVIQPERYGLSMLHQIRGRAARHGGVGYCDLYLPNPVKPKTLERLQVLERTQHGFEVAVEDLKNRGFGSLAIDSKTQAGADTSFLIGRPLSPELMERVLDKFGAKI